MTVIERSFGIIPIARVRDEYEILLAQHRSKEGEGIHWSFPKGHKNEGESNEDAAVRELKEETGIEIDIGALNTESLFEHSYRFMSEEGVVEKTNFYFPVFIEQTHDLTPGEDEIYKLRWMTIPTAKHIVGFESMRNLLAKIEEWLQSRDH